MNKQELYEAVLNENVSPETNLVNPVLKRIFTSNGYAMASDNHVLLCVRTELIGKDFPVKEDERMPNYQHLLENNKHLEGYLDTSMLVEPEGKTHYFIGGGPKLKGDIYGKMRELSFMLGVQCWKVLSVRDEDGKLNKEASIKLVTANEDIIMICMPVVGDMPNNVLIHLNEQDEEAYNVDLGIKNYAAIISKRKKDEEVLAQKRDHNIFCFTVARYANIYVEAADYQEAKKIAEDNMDDLDDSDFDCTEVESYEELGFIEDKDDLAASEAEHIYTLDGAVDIDDYFEE